MSNNKKIRFSTATVDFFPEDRPTRQSQIKSFAKRSRWPFVIGLFAAGIVAVGMAVGSGGLVIPGALFLGSFKMAVALWAKRAVITVCSLAGFAIGFALTKWFGIGRPKSPASFTLDMWANLNRDYQRDLTRELRVSSRHDHVISSYCEAEDTVVIRQDNGCHAIESLTIHRSEVFIPLRNAGQSFEDKLAGKTGVLTHYKKKGGLFRVYYKEGNQELDLTQEQINARINYAAPTHTHASTRTFIDKLPVTTAKQRREQYAGHARCSLM